ESLEALLVDLGMTETQFERDDEKRPGFWEQFTQQKARYLDFTRAAMYRFASEKDCVIVGRGGNIIFQGVPSTLRLRIIAPCKVRVKRLCERLGVDEQHALRMIHQSDHDRAGYHKYFFNTVWDSSTDYDLVVNTAAISPIQTCDAVATLLHLPKYAKASDLAREVLRDLRIAQDVFIAIAYRERILVMYLNVVCDKGVVSLHGTARSQAASDQCVGVAETVEGVVRTVNSIEVVPLAYYQGL
ncbi:MAG TPA: cytidylate kinase family protein, partial [Spirochaetia bacterium]|nr:cytidylate kinase family protein [Spirochaetia bacterium]